MALFFFLLENKCTFFMRNQRSNKKIKNTFLHTQVRVHHRDKNARNINIHRVSTQARVGKKEASTSTFLLQPSECRTITVLFSL